MTSATAWLFYSSWIAGIVLLPAGLFYIRRWQNGCIRRKEKEFGKQFQNALDSLAAALNVGYSMENAIRETQKDLRLMYSPQTPVVREFTRMVRQLELNITAEEAWQEFARRTDLPEVRSFVTVFTMSKRSGGDSIAVIRKAIRQISDRIDTEREIETILSAKRLEFHIMSAVPFGIVAYMKLSFPEFMGQLYGTAAGAVFMTLCLLVYGAAWRLGNQIIQIEV